MSGMNPHEVAYWKATPSRPAKRRPRAAFSYQESSWYVPAAASGSWTASAARCCSRTALPVLVVPMSTDLRVKKPTVGLYHGDAAKSCDSSDDFTERIRRLISSR